MKMSVSQIRTDCLIEINSYTYIKFRLPQFHSQLHCTIELNNRKTWKTWTKHIKSKQTLHDMHHNETNVKSHSDSGG